MGKQIVLFGVALSLLFALASGTFVFVEVVGRTPSVGQKQSKFGCYPAAFSGEDRTLSNLEGKVANPETACTSLQGSYEGMAVLVKRGGCTFKTKVRAAQAAGAAAIVVINDEPDFPVQMRLSESKIDPDQRYDDETVERNGIGIPACMTFSDSWELLAGAGVSGLRLSFAGYRKYFRGSERLPENDITSVGISKADGSFHSVPAAQATFNPETSTIVGTAHRVELDSKCFDPTSCTACWDLEHQIANFEELDKKVAVFHVDPGVDSCMMWMFEITALVQKAGASALVYVNDDETLWTWIPWLVPFDVAIPTFNVLRSDGKTALGRLALGEELQIQTPALQHYPSGCRPDRDVCIASGPSFREGGSAALPLTGLLFADYSAEEEPMTRLAPAGQAQFNPQEVTSTSESTQVFFAFQAPVAVTYFPEKCSVDVALEGGAGACAPCTEDVDVLRKMGVLDGKVALVLEEAIGCLGSWKTIVEAATALGAVAIIFGTERDQIGVLSADSQYRARIPAFVIGSQDATWLYERAERFSENPWDAPTRRDLLSESMAGRSDASELAGVVGFVPRIEDGAAQALDEQYAMASYAVMEKEIMGQDPGPAPTPSPPSGPSEDDLVRMTRITIKEEDNQYLVTAALAKFMSPTYPSVLGDAVWLHWWYCGNLDTCGACTRLMCEDILNKDDVKDKVALIWDHDVPCFGQDAVQAAYCAQELGAAGVVFVSDSGVSPMAPRENSLPSHMQPTTCMDGRYRAFCMPVFSVSGIAAVKLRNYVSCASAKDGEQLKCQRAVSANPAVRVELPGHHKNPSPFSSAGVHTGDDYLSTADENKGTRRELPDWGIGILVAAVVCTVLACALAVVRMRRRRAAAMSSATQEVTQSMIEDEEIDENAVVIQADPTRFRPGYAEAASGLATEAPFDPRDYAKSKLGFASKDSEKEGDAPGTSVKPGPAEADLDPDEGEPGLGEGQMEDVDIDRTPPTETQDVPNAK